MTSLNGVKVYNLSAGKKLPEWLPEAKRRSLVKEDEGYARRVQLLQDFDFTTASQDIKISSDGMYIAACGALLSQTPLAACCGPVRRVGFCVKFRILLLLCRSVPAASQGI